MSFTSLSFIAFVLVAALIGQGLKGSWRLAFILVANLIFAATYISQPLAALPLVAFVVAGYGAVLLAAGGRVTHGVAFSTVVLVAAFVWLKRYPFVEAIAPLPFPYALVGLSYILFRLLHVLFEVGGGTMKAPSFLRYLAYLFFFPAFLSGPIHRYEPFARDLDSPAPMDADAAFIALKRFLTGFAKVAVVGACLHLIQGAVAGRLETAVAGGAPGLLLAGLYAAAAAIYLVFLYANFSGYTDMAVAVARLFGVVLPENFNRPFTSTNFQDFWSRWHITLSDWFKIYFFNPLLKGLMSRFPSVAVAPYLGVLALFIVFVVLGFWHGASWEYLLTGVLLGVGIAANKLYQVEITKRMGKKPYKAMAARPVYAWASRGLTLAWVALSLTPFWLPVEGIAALMHDAGVVGSGLAIVLMSLAFIVPLVVLTWLERRVGASIAVNPLVRSSGARVVGLGVLIVVLLFAVPLLNSSSDFVYQAF